MNPLVRYTLNTLFLCLVCGACTLAQHHKHNKKGKEDKRPTEDLKSYNPSFPVQSDPSAKAIDSIPIDHPQITPRQDDTYKVDQDLDSLYENLSNRKTTNGYRVLISTTRRRTDAEEMRSKIYDIVTNENIYIEWEAPIFRVKVGDYTDRLEAHEKLGLLQKTFSTAVVIPDKIKITKPSR